MEHGKYDPDMKIIESSLHKTFKDLKPGDVFSYVEVGGAASFYMKVCSRIKTKAPQVNAVRLVSTDPAECFGPGDGFQFGPATPVGLCDATLTVSR